MTTVVASLVAGVVCRDVTNPRNFSPLSMRRLVGNGGVIIIILMVDLRWLSGHFSLHNNSLFRIIKYIHKINDMNE